MAVAIDAHSQETASPGFVNLSQSWTHTPVGTPRGIVVIIIQEAGADEVTGVTYGGVTMTRLRRDVRSTAEAGCVYVYFLGSGILTGARTVAVTMNGTGDDWNGHCWSLTATGDTTGTVNAGDFAASASPNPSLAITPTQQAVICYGIWTGLAAPVATPEAGTNHRETLDMGADSGMWADKTVASGGATTIGYTAASEVWAHSAVAVQEATPPISDADSGYGEASKGYGEGYLGSLKTTRTNSYSSTFESDTVGAAPAGWTIEEGGGGWTVQNAPAGMTGKVLRGVTQATTDDYIRKDHASSTTTGYFVSQHTVKTPSSTTGRAGNILFYDSSDNFAFNVLPFNGNFYFQNGTIQPILTTWAADTVYNITVTANADTKKVKVRINGVDYDNAGAWYDWNASATNLAKTRFSRYAANASTFYIDNPTGDKYVEPAAAPTTTGTLTTTGTVDGVVLGTDKYGRVVMHYANSDPLITNIRLERSGNNSTWVEPASATVEASASGWIVTDDRPQYGAQNTTYGGSIYYRVSGYNGGGSTPTSASGALTADVNITNYETSRFAAISGHMANSYVASSVAGGEVYPVYFLSAMAYAYAKTGTSQYLTDVQNQFDYIQTLTQASGIVQYPDYATVLYRDHHWRVIYHSAAAARLLRRAGATTLATEMLNQCDAWVTAFYTLNSNSPLSSVTRSGWDANNTTGANAQLVWTASTSMPLGKIVRPVTPNGRTYRVTTAGTSNATQPTWPTTNGGTVTVNGVTYTETTVTGDTSYGTYSETGPNYTASGGENQVDLNQNAEECAALSLLLTDPQSALYSAGALRTKALNHLANTSTLITAYQTSTGAVPIGDTFPAASGPGGYDTTYGGYALGLMAVCLKYTPTLVSTWWPKMVTDGLGWLTTNYSTEPLTGVHYSGGTYVTHPDIAFRDYPYAVMSVTNPNPKLRYTAATNDPDTNRHGNYVAIGGVVPDVANAWGRSFPDDVITKLLETATIAVAGTSAGTSTDSGALTITRPLAGTSAGTSSTSGALIAPRPLAGTSAGTSTTSGSLVAPRPLAGTSAGTSTTAGTLGVPRALAATDAGTSTTAGRLSLSTDVWTPQIIVPAYFYPTWWSGSPWDTLEATTGNIAFVVMNDSNGHATAINSDYGTEVTEAKAAGLKVLAYIETSYGAPDYEIFTDTFDTGVDAFWNILAQGNEGSDHLNFNANGQLRVGEHADLVNRGLKVEVLSTGGSAFASVGVDGATNFVDLRQYGTTLEMWHNSTQVATATYNSTTHRWWKVMAEEEDGIRQVAAYTSPDGVTWTEFGRDSAAWVQPNVMECVLGSSGTQGSGIVAMDNFSVVGDAMARIKTEIRNHESWYDVDGYFLDEAASGTAGLPFYDEIRHFVNSELPIGKRTLITNHGTNPDEGYVNVSDILVTFEGDPTAYASWTPSAWQSAYPENRFYHIIYNASTLEPTLATAKSRNAGYIYITDDVLPNPFDTLPAYWSTEQASVSAGPVALAGTSAGTSSTSGALTVARPLAGTSAGTSTDSGAVVATKPLAGTSAGTSTDSGAIIAPRPLAGTSAGTSTDSGAIIAPRPLAGTSAGTSTDSGAIIVPRSLAGTSAGTSTDAGALRVAWTLAGTSAGTSTTVGELAGGFNITGTSAGTSTTSGSLSVAMALAGTSAGTSTDSGALGLGLPLAGTSAGTSTDSGGATITRPLAGTSAGTSTDTGTLTAAVSLAGTSAGTSTTTGATVNQYSAEDSFIGTAGTNLNTHTPDVGTGWVRHSAGSAAGANIFLTADNRIRRSAAGTTGVLYYESTDPGFDNYAVRADWIRKSNTTTYTGIAARIHATANTAYLGRFNRDVTAWEIVKIVAGTTTQVAASGAVNPTIGQVYVLELQVREGQQTLLVDGVMVAESFDTEITHRGFGGVRAADNGGTDSTGTHLDSYKLLGNLGVVLNATDAGTSTDAGTLTVAQTLAGTSAGTSTTSGNLGVTRPLAGTSAGTSADTGDLVATKPLAGISIGTSTTAGQLTSNLPTAIRRASVRNRPGTVVEFELHDSSVDIGRAATPTGSLPDDNPTTIRRAAVIGRPPTAAVIEPPEIEATIDPNVKTAVFSPSATTAVIGAVDVDATIEDHDTSAD